VRVSFLKESFLSILLAEVGVGSRNRAGAGIIGTGCADVNHVDISTYLTMTEDQAIGADPLLQGQMIDHSIDAIPAKLLARLGGLCVGGDHSLTVRCIAEHGSKYHQCILTILGERSAVTLEIDAGELNVCARSYRGLDVAAALGIRALTNTVSIYRLALCRSDQLLVFAVGYTVAVGITAYAMRINRATSRGFGLAVELVSYTITISVIQDRLRHLHALGRVEFAVSEVQGVEPVERLNRLIFLAEVEVQTCGEVVVRIKVAGEGSVPKGMLLPALTIEEVVLNEGHAIFDGEVDAGRQLEGNTCADSGGSAGSVVAKDARLLRAMTLSGRFIGIIQQVTQCLADIRAV